VTVILRHSRGRLRFAVLLQFDGGASAVAEWTTTDYDARRTADVSPLGYINGFIAAFDVNRAGRAFVSEAATARESFLKAGAMKTLSVVTSWDESSLPDDASY